MSALIAVAMPPGSSASPVSVGVKPSSVCANSGKRKTPPYSPKPSAMKRKIDAGEVAVLQHAEVDDRMLVPRRQLPPEHRDRQTAERIARRMISGSSNQSFAFPSSSTYCSARQTPTISSADAEPIDRPRVPRCCSGGSCRNVNTRNADDDADRHVDEEAPVPGVVVGDPAAERRAERGRDDDAEQEDRLHQPLLLAREDLADRRLRGREQRRAARALKHAPQHDLAQAVRRAAEERGDDEQHDRGRQVVAAARSVAVKNAVIGRTTTFDRM